MFRVKNFFSGLLLSGAFLLPAVAHAQTNHKLALIVGISDYQHAGAAKTGWWNLHAQNDLAAFGHVLQGRFGFAAADVTMLSDAQATRQNIVQAFEKQLIDKAKPGDIVIFHFSGHGQRVADDNGDEADGMDESLVPYDAISQKASDGAKTNLRDDQLDDLLERLRQKMLGPDGKLKGNIAVSIDAGFSGAAQADGALVQRGRGWDEALDGPLPKAAPKGKLDSASGLFAQGEAQSEGYVVLSAAANDQAAHEIVNEGGQSMGALSSYLTRALARSTPDTTYRPIFERLAVEFGTTLSDQTPQLEGDVDRVLLDGSALPLPPYLVVQSVENDVVTLPVGTLQGVTPLSRYTLYQAGSDITKDANRIAQVEVTSVGLTASRARLVKNEDANAPQVLAGDLTAARAVESEHSYGDSSLKVRIEAPGDWANTVKELEMVSLIDDKAARYDLLLRGAEGKIIVQRPDGSVLTQFADDATAPDKLQKFLTDQWRWQFLVGLHNDDPKATLQVALRLVPVRVKLNAKGLIDSVVSDRDDVEITDGNRLVLRDGDYVALELRNNSAEDAYVTVLDLSPDGSINPMFPHPQAPHDNKIVADKQWHRLPMPFVFTMGPPYGHEIFKAIATREPADFSSLLQGQTVEGSRGAPKNPLGALLLSSSTGRRGANFADISPGDWSTAAATFEVQAIK